MTYELFQDCIASLSILGGHIDSPYHLCPVTFENVSNTNISGTSQQTTTSTASSCHGNTAMTTDRPYSHLNLLNTDYGIISKILPNDLIEIMTTSDSSDHDNNNNNNNSNNSSSSSSNSSTNKNENSNNDTIQVPWDKVTVINRCPIEGLNIPSSLIEAVLILTYKLVLNPCENKNEIKNVRREKEIVSDIILCSKNEKKELEIIGKNEDCVENKVVEEGETVRDSVDLPLPLPLPSSLSPAAPAVHSDSLTEPGSSVLSATATSAAVDTIFFTAVSTITTAGTNTEKSMKIKNAEEEKEIEKEIEIENENENEIEIDKKEKKNSKMESKFLLRYISLLSSRATSSLSSILPSADLVQNILTRNILQKDNNMSSENISLNNVPSKWKILSDDFLVNLLEKSVQLTKSAGEDAYGFFWKKVF